MTKPNKISDYTLVENLKANDESSFRSLFDRYQEDLYYYARSLVKVEAQAEEIVQDVFLKVWLNRHSLNPDLSFKAFIFTLARNFAFNFLKKASNDRELIRKVFYKSQKNCKPSDHSLHEAEYEKLGRQAIDALPPRCRLVYKMSRNEGKTYEEIGSELNISVNTVKNQMNKALGNIREFLSLHGDIVFLMMVLLGNK